MVLMTTVVLERSALDGIPAEVRDDANRTVLVES